MKLNVQKWVVSMNQARYQLNESRRSDWFKSLRPLSDEKFSAMLQMPQSEFSKVIAEKVKPTATVKKPSARDVASALSIMTPDGEYVDDDDPELIAAFGRVMYLSEIGEHALQQFPNETLNLVRKPSCPHNRHIFDEAAPHKNEKTYYDGGRDHMLIDFTTLQDRDPSEQCAVLCHETFHFMHHRHNRAAYLARLRRHSEEWSNLEEQLTITGDCAGIEEDGFDYLLFNENTVLRGFKLPERTSHDA